jgi:4-amino-4-deoxy-L-arabinose transferase-like glycosyltransferase
MRKTNAVGGLESRPSINTAAERTQLSARWLPLGQGAILLLATALRLWRLGQNGYGNEYYTAAVRSMTTSWHNFWYNAFDPAGFISVDKPPVALWIQVASVKLFGFSGLSVLLPQVLEGVAAVALVYYLVQRWFGTAAGLLAALFLAMTPVSVAIDRSNNTDSCLVLVLLLAAWALMRAAEEGSRGRLLLSQALIGLGFNVKMLAAYVVLPIFALVYSLGTPQAWRRRLVDVMLATLVLVAVSLLWMLAYDLAPTDHRPFVGSSKSNSMLELAFGHNGIGRFVRRTRSAPTAGMVPGAAPPALTRAQRTTGAGASTTSGLRNDLTELLVRVPVGPWRLADGQLAGQVGWLFPLALMGFVIGVCQSRCRWPLAPVHLALTLWGGWTLMYGVVYSYAGGVFHFYYLATMAPPLAALAGIGVVRLWSCYLQRGWRTVLLPATLCLTAAWQTYIESSSLGWKVEGAQSLLAALSAAWAQAGAWRLWLSLALLGSTLVAVTGLCVIALRQTWTRSARVLAASALGLGLAGLLLLPGAWALSSVLVGGHAVLPSANLSRLVPGDGNAEARAQGRFSGLMNLQKLVGFLQANHRDERYLLGTSSTLLAAPIIIATGEAVLARGGFQGLDPVLTPEKLAQMVAARQLRFVMVGDLSSMSRRLGAEEAGRPIAGWVRAHGTPVDPTLWRSQDLEAGRRSLMSRMQLYDLRPEAGVVPTLSP